MTFTVTYREKNGAKAELEIEAASRAECFAQCKARGIAPLSVREGKRKGSGKNAASQDGERGRAGARPSPTRKLFTIRFYLFVAIAALAAIAWWGFGRDKAKPAEPTVVEKPKAAKPQPAPKREAKPAVTNAPPPAAAQPAKPALKDLPPEKRDEYIAKKILENPPDLSPSTNRTFKTGVEQVASWIFTTRLGDTPPPLPRISIRDKAHIRAILDAPNLVDESDSERVADVKQTVEQVKKLLEPVAKPLAQLLFEPLNTRKYERNSRISFRVFRVFRGFAIASLDEYISNGGDVQDFFAYYHGQLKEAHNIWRQNQMNMLKVLKEEPEAAAALIDAMNEEMAEKGIKPLMVPPKYRKQLGLE